MGRLADEVRDCLRDRLADRLPAFEWTVERDVGGTPVDVAGASPERLVAVELAWRRADPADDAAKLFRHLAEGSVESGRVDVCQAFAAYYDHASGGVSSTRANAEFVGQSAADSLGSFEYHAVDLHVEPPRSGGEFEGSWEAAIDAAVDRIAEDAGQESVPVAGAATFVNEPRHDAVSGVDGGRSMRGDDVGASRGRGSAGSSRRGIGGG